MVVVKITTSVGMVCAVACSKDWGSNTIIERIASRDVADQLIKLLPSMEFVFYFILFCLKERWCLVFVSVRGIDGEDVERE